MCSEGRVYAKHFQTPSACPVLMVALGGGLPYHTHSWGSQRLSSLPTASERWNQNQNWGLRPPSPFCFPQIPSFLETYFHGLLVGLFVGFFVWGFLVQVYFLYRLPSGSVAKNLSATQEPPEIQVQSLGREDPLWEEMATHSSILAWRIPWTEEPSRLQSIGSQRVGHNWNDLAHRHFFVSFFFLIFILY